MYFDSHAHLDSQSFEEDLHEVIMRAFDAGVKWIMNPAANYESSIKSVELAEKYPGIYAAVGVHPHDASTVDEAMIEKLAQLAQKKAVRAIGEIGLDYHYDFSPRHVQKDVFRKQLQLAKSLDLPVIIHDREAHQDVLDLLKEEKAFERGVLMHCFSGSAELARQYTNLGAMISIAGPVSFKNARKTVEVVEAIDLRFLMIETDSPYLAPVPKRGKRNEPLFVKHVCEKVAEIKKISVEEVAEATRENAMMFFGIEKV